MSTGNSLGTCLRRGMLGIAMLPLLLGTTQARATRQSTSWFGRRSSVLSTSRFMSPRTRVSSSPLHSTLATSCPRRPLLSVRGGALLLDSDDDESSDNEDFQFDDDDFELEGDLDIAEDDFAEDNTLDRILDAWKKTPPLTKSFLSASIFATMWGYLFQHNTFPRILLLEWKPTFTRLQLWRPLTAFLNIGPFGLGYVMTAHFLWTYMSTLERLNHNRPYDFWIMILFGMVSMVAGYGFFRLEPRFLGHNLSTFLVYIWSRYHEGLEVNMFELFNTRAELLPWFFLAQTFLLEGELPLLDFLGIVFGHIYHHCKTVNILRAPDAVVNWYHNEDNLYSTAIRKRYKDISSDFELQ